MKNPILITNAGADVSTLFPHKKNPTVLRQLRATGKESKPTSSLAVRDVHIS